MLKLLLRGLGLCMFVVLVCRIPAPTVFAGSTVPTILAHTSQAQSTQPMTLNSGLLTASAVVSGTWNSSIGLPAHRVESIAMVNDTLYALHSTNEVTTFSRWQNKQWTPIQTATVSDTWKKLQTGSDGKLYAIHTRTEVWRSWYIAMFDGTTWVDVTAALPFINTPDSFVAFNNNQIYVIDNNSKLAIWNGSTWTIKIARESGEGDFGGLRDLHLCGDRLYYVVLMAYSQGENVVTQLKVKKIALNDQSISVVARNMEYAICEGDARYGWWVTKIIFGTETSQTRVFQVEPASSMFTEISSMVRNGSYIYVAGSFDSIDGVEVNGLARWNGQHWEGIAPGFDTTNLSNLLIHQNQVYVAGSFSGPIGIASQNVAQWTASFNHHIHVPLVAK